jgi:hypothetical protein
VGPSYVNELNSFGGNIHNLGLPALCPAELKRLISSYCRGNDTIYYGVNLWVAFTLRWPGGEIAYSALDRHKGALKSLFVGSVDKKDVELREKIRKKMPLAFSKLTKQDLKAAIFFLQELHRQHPNVRFIIFPAKADNEARENIELFRRYLLESDLPVIDLSAALSEAQLADFMHATPEGNKIIRDRIIAAVSAEPTADINPL